MHAQQMRRHGRIVSLDPKVGSVKILQDLIQSVTSECAIPKFKSRNNMGYPVARFQGKLRLASHVVMELVGNPRPKGMEILHSCDNPECVNPRHMRWGTHSENLKEAVTRGRWKHPRGYSYGDK